MERLERLAPLAGVAAGLLWLVGILVIQTANPTSEDGATAIVSYFTDDRPTILAGSVLVILGTFLFFWFLAALTRLMRDSLAASAAAIGGTAGGVMMLALTGPHTTGATTDVELLGAESSVAFWRLSHTFFVGAEVSFAVFVAAVALAGLTGRGGGPRWLAWSGLALAALLLVLPLAWLALIFLLPAWVSAAAIIAWRRPGAFA